MRTFKNLGKAPFVIAEVSGNHNGSLERALQIVEAAAASGVDAVKFQTYTPDTITLDIDSPRFKVSADHPLWGGLRLFELYRQAHTPWEWHEELFTRATSLGLVAFSSPFDETAVDFLESLDAPIYKIASLEIVDLPLIAKVSATGKPVIISTGTASLGEIEAAVKTARSNDCDDLTLLVCSSSYPADPESVNLLRLGQLSSLFDAKVGYSDHTVGNSVALAAVALGAQVIEKHLTLDKRDGGVDSAFSADQKELSELVKSARSVALALGSPQVWGTESESESIRLRPSLFVTRDVEPGEVLDQTNVRSVRPSGGLPPGDFSKVQGLKFRAHTSAGTPLSWELLN